MWEWFVGFLKDVLTYFAGITGDWGLAVIMLTVIIRLLVMPLMTRSTASSAKMQALQPLLIDIQERYADNPQKQAEEMRKFYAEHKFNPLGGCLPVLLQMPVFFALFSVARDVPASAHFLNILPSLSMSVSGAMASTGLPDAIVYIIFDVAFGILTFIPMVLNSTAISDGQQRTQQLIMGGVMGLMMMWFGWNVPAAVLLYYDTSAVWQVIQQQLVTKRVMARVKQETEAKLQNQGPNIDVVRKERKARPKKKS